MEFSDLLPRLELLTPLLPEPERSDAERLLSILSATEGAQEGEGLARPLTAADGDGPLTSADSPREGGGLARPLTAADEARELSRLVELLGRRAARALPFAVTGRARLAQLAGAPKDAERLLTDASERLSRAGY